MQLSKLKSVILRQRKEAWELMGFETRNKFEILGEDGKTSLGFAAEQGKGLGAHFARHFLGHWRTFEIHFFDAQKQFLFKAVHPFRFIFQRLEIVDTKGFRVGALQQRFSILTKRFDVEDGGGTILFTVSSPIWKPWTFPFTRGGRQIALVKKKWSGLLKETFLDADNFKIDFDDSSLTEAHRQLILAAGLFIDLQYFEKKAD